MWQEFEPVHFFNWEYKGTEEERMRKEKERNVEIGRATQAQPRTHAQTEAMKLTQARTLPGMHGISWEAHTRP